MTIRTDIARAKRRLVAKAKTRGMWENFGDREVRKLKDKHDYLSLRYGCAEDRAKAALLEDFDNWCLNYTGSDVTRSNLGV